MHPVKIPSMDWNNVLRPHNSFVQYFGSDIRLWFPETAKWHAKTGIMGLSAWDYTMLEKYLTFYHVPLMFDMNEIPTADQYKSGPLRVCHSPTRRTMKKTDVFIKAMDNLRARGVDVETVLIENMSNKECLRIKLTCHVTFDQLGGIGIYGMTAIESMAMGHVVLCNMSNFATSCYPNNPIVYVDEESLESRIEELANDRGHRDYIGRRSREWVREHHDPWTMLKRYLWLYDLVVNGHRIVNDLNEYFIQETP